MKLTMKFTRLTFLLALLLGSILTVQAQHETLFNNARLRGAFGGPIYEYGLGNDLGTSVGGGGALVFNNFFIGGYGLGSVDFNRLFDQGDIDVINIGHGGFWLGGTYRPHSLFHVYGSARLGWGAVNIDVEDDNLRYRDVDKIFAATPEIGLELNLTTWCRVAGTVGYRFVNGVNESNGLNDEDFSGGIAAITLRFGWFGRHRSNNW